MLETISASVSIGWSEAKPIQQSVSIRWDNILQTPIIIKAIVERITEVENGYLIKAMEPPWREIALALSKNPNALSHLTPRQWEELIAASYDKAGFDEVILTPQSGDFGRDVIAIRKGWGSIRIIDQVKAYKPGHLVTANDVRALVGVLATDHKASKGIVTTTSSFAPKIALDPSIAPLIPYRLELVDGPTLAARFAQLGELLVPKSGA